MKKFLIIWTVITIIIGTLAMMGQIATNREQRERKAKIHSIWTGKTLTSKMIDFSEEDAEQVVSFVIFISLFWGVPVGLVSLITLALRKK